MSSLLITSTQEFSGIVAIVNPGKSQFDQTIKFAKIGSGAEEGKVTIFETTKFRKRGVECDGPILPHEKKVGSMELGPKRPCLKIVATPETDAFNFFISIDLATRAGYEFSKTKLGEAFPELLTFSYANVTLAPTRASPNGTPAKAVLIIGKNGATRTLSDFLPANLSAIQSAAIAQLAKDKRISEKDCIDEDDSVPTSAPSASSGSPGNSKIKIFKTFVFENLEPRVDVKSKRLYLDMNLTHKTYPNNNRHYRSDKNPYTPEMSDIKQWGIVIPILARVGDGYGLIQGSDWTQDPTFKAVTKPNEYNNFVGTVNFTVDSVMEGSGHVKTWWTCSVSKQPEASSRGGDRDYDEEIILPPSGKAVSLVATAKLGGNATIGDDDGNEP